MIYYIIIATVALMSGAIIGIIFGFKLKSNRYDGTLQIDLVNPSAETIQLNLNHNIYDLIKKQDLNIKVKTISGEES